MKNKNELRIIAKQKREEIFCQEKNDSVLQNIVNSSFYKNAGNIMAFYPVNSEVDLTPLFLDKSKNWFLPKVKVDELLVCSFRCGDELIQGKFKIKEPAAIEIPDLGVLDIILVPGLACDAKGNRLGYGKGFYDRFLTELPARIKIIFPVFDELIFDNIPSDSFDKKVQVIISDKRVLTV